MLDTTKIGTGVGSLLNPYTTDIASIAQKQEIAKALLAKGLAGGTNYKSWAEPLGDIAEVWAGKHLQKKADEGQADLNSRVTAAYHDVMSRLTAKMGDPNSTLGDLAPLLESPLISDDFKKPLLDAFGKQYENKATVEGAPIELKGPNGIQTYNRTKAGGISSLPGGLGIPPTITNVNDVAVDLQSKPDGTVLPQDADKLTIHGPGGGIVQNPAAIGAHAAVAAAGRPLQMNKIDVNNAKAFGEGAEKILADSHDVAQQAAMGLQTTADLRAALKTGHVMTGPGTNAVLTFNRLFGTNSKQLAATRQAVQSLAKMVLANRGLLKGQGAVSDFESKLVAKAATDDIDQMSPAELNVVADASDRQNNYLLKRHQSNMENARRIPGVSPMVDMYNVGPNPVTDNPPAGTSGSVLDQIRARRRQLMGH